VDEPRRSGTEQRSPGLLERAPDLVFTLSPDGIITSLSPSFDRMIGWPAVRWVGRAFVTLVHPDERPVAAVLVERARRGEEVPMFELRLRTSRGGHLTARVTTTPLMDGDGLAAILGVARDVTERQPIQDDPSPDRVAPAEDPYRRLVELAPDGIAIHKQGVVVFANSAAARLMGAQDPADLVGRSILPFIHADSRPAALERLQQLREGSAVAPLHERFVRLDGTVIDVEVAATPFVHEGEPAVQVIIRDITDRLETGRLLRESEERHRRLVEVSPDAIFVHGDGRFVFANAAAARLLGASGPEQIVGTPVLEVIHPDLRQSAASRMRREIDFGEIVQALEDRFVRFDGRTVDVEVTAMPMTLQGRKTGLIMARDITGRRLAEDALRQRTAYLAALHETALGLIDHLRLDELLEAIVSRAGALIGTEHGFMYLAAEPGSGHITVQVGTGMYRERVGYRMPLGEGLAGTVWQTGQPLVVRDYATWDGAHPDWKDAGLHSAIGVPLTSGVQVVGVLGLCYTEPAMLLGHEEVELLTRFAALASVALDNARLYTAAQRELQERRQAEDQLGTTEAKYRTLVEQIPAISYIDSWAGPGTTLYISPQSSTILGITPEEWLADPELLSKTIHVDDRERWREQTARSDRTGEPFRLEYRIRARDGRVVWVRDEAVLVRDDTGNPSFWQGVMFDITAAKAAEERLVEAFEQERGVAERLRSVDEMKTTFLHAVSHELRTPLSSILGMALTLERDHELLATPDGAELVGRMAANARKLNHLLSDLLDLDRLDRGILEPRRKPTDVAALVRRVLESTDVLSDRMVHVDADALMVPIDAPKVERIVENLLANGARHTPAGTSLWMTIRGRDGGVEIAVADEGEGVPEDLRDAIFEPFRQGPAAPTHSPGVGIGLSLVARLAGLHGGRAWVEDRPGGGASFRVFLPGA
jgi:PAS domain S-box-containing protein